MDSATAYVYNGEAQRVRKLIGENTRFIYGVGVHLQHDSFTRYGETDQEGNATFKMSKAPLGQCELVVTRMGYLPVFEQIQIVA